MVTAELLQVPANSTEMLGFRPEPLPLDYVSITLPPVLPPSIDPVAVDSFTLAREANDIADAMELDRLQGIYRRQLDARISRVWEQLNPIGSDLTNCVAHIIQDESGRVLDIDLTQCAADETTLSAILGAIRGASPLPSPPDGLAMGSYIKFEFPKL